MRASAFVLLLLLAPAAALAEPALDDVAEDAEAYCGANIGVAKSKARCSFRRRSFWTTASSTATTHRRAPAA